MLTPGPHLVHADRVLAIDALHRQIFGFNNRFQPFAHTGIHMDKVTHAQRLFHEFIAIGIRNPALGRTKLGACLGKAGFLQAVFFHMERHRDGGAVRNFQVCRADLNPLLTQRGNLLFKMCRIDDHPPAHNADNLRAKNA